MLECVHMNKISDKVDDVKKGKCEIIHYGVLEYNGNLIGLRIIVDKITTSAILALEKNTKVAHRFFEINPKNCKVAFDFTLEGIAPKYVDELLARRKSKGMAVYVMKLDKTRGILTCHDSSNDVLEVEKDKLKTVLLKSVLRED